MGCWGIQFLSPSQPLGQRVGDTLSPVGSGRYMAVPGAGVGSPHLLQGPTQSCLYDFTTASLLCGHLSQRLGERRRCLFTFNTKGVPGGPMWASWSSNLQLAKCQMMFFVFVGTDGVHMETLVAWIISLICCKRVQLYTMSHCLRIFHRMEIRTFSARWHHSRHHSAS